MDINRLKWASRRGMLELDLILMPFLENRYAQLNAADQERFEKLLVGEDTDLFSWFMGKSVPEDPELKIIVDLIRQYSQSRV